MMTSTEMIENDLKMMAQNEIQNGLPPCPPGTSHIQYWNKNFKKISIALNGFCVDKSWPADKLEAKLEIITQLKEHLDKTVFNEPIEEIKYKIESVFPFGSSTTGLGTKKTKISMTFVLSPLLDASLYNLSNFVDFCEYENTARFRTEAVVNKIIENLNSEEKVIGRTWEDVDFYECEQETNIVIGKVDHIDFDIKITFKDTVSPNHLSMDAIRLYQRYHHKFLPLAIIICQWLKCKRERTAKVVYQRVVPDGATTVLLVIIFMKHYKLLPVDSRRRRKSGAALERDIERWKESTSFDANVVTLFLLFTHFYTKVVPFEDYRFNVGDGTFSLRRERDPQHFYVFFDIGNSKYPGVSDAFPEDFAKFLLHAQAILRNYRDPEMLETLFSIGIPSEITSFEIIDHSDFVTEDVFLWSEDETPEEKDDELEEDKENMDEEDF